MRSHRVISIPAAPNLSARDVRKDAPTSWKVYFFYPIPRCLLQTAKTYPKALPLHPQARPWRPLTSPRGFTAHRIKVMMCSSATGRVPVWVASTLATTVPPVTKARVSRMMRIGLVDTRVHICECLLFRNILELTRRAGIRLNLIYKATLVLFSGGPCVDLCQPGV